MISRIWHGWTLAENADAYERLLREEIFAGIAARAAAGMAAVEDHSHMRAAAPVRPIGNAVE